MKVVRRYDQYRRDLSVDMECESCGNKETYTSAYDDRYFWDEVQPNFECKSCSKSTKDLELPVTPQHTMYPEGFQI